MNKKHHVFLITTLVVVAVLLAGLATQNLKAQVSTINLSGWSWSSYTTGPGGAGSPGGLGWTSFNADNHAAGPAYKVTMNSVSGDLSGQAFSSNYGWLSFDRSVTGNPPFEDIGSGSGAIAKKDAGNNITGWARFISACKNDLWDTVNRKCTGSGAGNANGVSSTASSTTSTTTTGGNVIMAADYGGYIYISRDAGVNWTQATTPGTGVWLGTAMSSDGSRMVAVKYSSRIYTSDDSGVTWTPRTSAGSRNWSDAAISSDGKYMVASADGNYIYTSDDYGVNWAAKTSSGSRSWNDVVTSDDGQTILASTDNSIYISKNGGTDWSLSTSSVGIAWTDVEISSDGSSYFVGMSTLSGGKSAVYTSSDGGLTWIKRIESSVNSPKWDGLSMTPDGKQITAGLTDSQACTKTSYDYGVTWTTGHCESSSGSYIFDTTTSGNGSKIISTFKNGKYLYASNDKGVTWAPITSAGLRDWNKIEINRGFAIQQQSTSTQQNAYWDGWVSLNRKATDTIAYGLTYDTTTKAVKGYAWGSNNVGWIWFDPTGCAPGSDCNPVVGSDPIVGSCSVSPTSIALSATTTSANATWSVTSVSGGKGAPYHYVWAGTGALSGTTTNPVTISYSTAGTYSASVLVSDMYYTSTTSSPILCSNSLTVTGPGGGGGGGSCITPDNAQLCTGSNQSSGPVIIGEYGSCPTAPTTPAICQFQCIDDTYIVRGYSCIKKSTTVEQ